ncbi:hypothetical protein INR49_025215 [Caranx melampygus]|nr:hypothetical protein INR49_025215 [Caranx melampygus]
MSKLGQSTKPQPLTTCTIVLQTTGSDSCVCCRGQVETHTQKSTISPHCKYVFKSAHFGTSIRRD